MKSTTILSVLAVCAVAAPLADAHFKLLEPESAIIEAANGDPQKAFPCGIPPAGSRGNPPTPSNAVTKLKGGQKLHFKLQETVYHPGHYRVALAATRAKLPVDPPAVTREGARGPQSVSAPIEKDPKPPVLADGLWVHSTAPARGATLPAFEADIEIPNVNCPTCVMQVIQFMAEHGLNALGDYSYHHCADVQITADTTKPISKAWTDALAAK